MIARVYPLKRMSRRLAFFDYLVPEGWQVQRGDGVRIPFRAQTLFGIVAKVTDKPARGVRLKALIEKVPALSIQEDELLFLERAAFDLLQSVPALLYTVLPTPSLKPTSLSSSSEIALSVPVYDPVHISHANILRSRTACFLRIHDLADAAEVIGAYLQAKPGQAVAVLAPHVRDVELLRSALSSHHPVIVTGEETVKQRSLAWSAFRTGASTLLIGTKLAVFLTHPSLDTLFLVRSSHSDHKQRDRNPRYDARTVALLRKSILPCRIVFIDVMARVDDLALFPEADRLGVYPPPESVQIIAMNKERPTSAHPAFGSTTVAHMQACLERGGRVLCVNNHAADGAFGSRELSKALQKLFPGIHIGIVQKTLAQGQSNASIVLASEFYLEQIFNPFAPTSFGLVVMLNADQALRAPTFRAFEQAAYQVEQWRALARRAGASFFMQTDEPELFAQYLANQEARLKEELASRQAFQQPPALRWITVEYKAADVRERQVALHEVKRGVLALSPTCVCLLGNDLQIGLPEADVERVFEQLKLLDDAYIIDTTAFS